MNAAIDPARTPGPPLAESAYLFRHALLRDAAYQLQMPADRARLHGLALAAIEGLAGGRPPVDALDQYAGRGTPPHPTDPFAWELAEHARLAGASRPAFAAARAVYLRRAAIQLEKAQDNAGAGRLWEEHAGLVGGVERGKSLHRAGISAVESGRAADASSLFGEALRLFQEHGDRRLEAVALVSLARHAGITGRVAECERHFDLALKLERELGDRGGEAVVLEGLATLYDDTGRAELAEKHRAEAIASFRASDDRYALGLALGNLGAGHARAGRIEEAERVLREALDLHREAGNRRLEARVMGDLAGLCWVSGRTAEAARAYAHVIAFARESGNARVEGVALGNLAGLCAASGDLPRAEELFRQALDIHRKFGHRRFEGAHQCGRAMVLLELGRFEESRENWRQGAAILEEIGDTAELAQQTARMKAACERAGVAWVGEAGEGR